MWKYICFHRALVKYQLFDFVEMENVKVRFEHFSLFDCVHYYFYIPAIISLARTTIHFNPAHPKMISFKGNLPCRVMSKSIGENSDLWEIEVQGRRGFAPKKMLMEQKILIKAADLIKVEDEPIVDEQINDLEYASEQIENESSSKDKDDVDPQNDPEKSSNNEEEISAEESAPAVIEPITTKQIDNSTGSYENEDNKLNNNENVRLEIVSVEREEPILFINSSDVESNINSSSQSTTDSDINLNIDYDEASNTNLRQQIHNKDTIDEVDDKLKMNDNDLSSDISDKIEVDSQTIKKDYGFSEKSREDVDVLNSAEEKKIFIEMRDITTNHEISGKTEESQHTSAPSFKNGQFDVKIDNANENNSNEIKSNDEKYKSILKHSQEDTHEIKRHQIINESELPEKSSSDISEISEITKNTHMETKTVENENPRDETPIEIEYDWVGELYISLQSGFNSLKQIFGIHAKEQAHSTVETKYQVNMNGYCKNIEKHSCRRETQKLTNYLEELSEKNEMLYSNYVDEFLARVITMTDLVILLILTASAILIFIFGHYFLTNHNKEIMLLSKLNALERKLLTSKKECALAKVERNEIQLKLNTVANKSFGANDMVKQHEKEKNELFEQISALESELEAAAEAGLELNKMVAELLSNQNGSDSIINTVQELQHQLNEQEAATIYINNLLAEKSRENSELQVILADTNKQFGAEIQELINENKKIEMDKEIAETRLKELEENMIALEIRFRHENELKLNEISNFKEECVLMKTKYDEVYSKWQAMKDALEKLEGSNGPGGMNRRDVIKIIEITEANAKYLAKVKESESLRDQLEAEVEKNKCTHDQLNKINTDINCLRDQFNRSEKDKLEAQTRLEVLSTYFKEKESQLEKCVYFMLMYFFNKINHTIF